MGFNTSVVLLNDMFHKWPEEIQQAAHRSMWPKVSSFDKSFGYGMVCHQSHADDTQVVIIGRNVARLARECEPGSIDWWALEQMKDALEKNGFKVTKRRTSK